MQYYRCKCGSYEGWNSGMPIPACAWCEKCQTTPHYNSTGHKTEKPAHKMIATKVQIDDGEGTLTRCRSCLRTAKQLEGEPMEPAS